MQNLWRFGCKLCNRSLGVHEPKWTSHVKRPSDVAQSYTSSGMMQQNVFKNVIFFPTDIIAR